MDQQGENDRPERLGTDSSGVVLGDLVRSLVSGLPGEQARLDRAYLERLTSAAAMASHLPAGWHGLAAFLAPSRPLLAEVTVGTEFRFTERAEEELGLGVELLSLGYRRRFAYSGFTSNTSTFVVRQVPLAPGARTPSSVPEEVEPSHAQRQEESSGVL